MVSNKLLELGMRYLVDFFIKQGFNREKVDTTLFVRHKEKHILLVQIYEDDIIFWSSNESLCREFASLM